LETLGYDQADLEGKPATIIFPAPMRNSDQVSWIWVGAKRRGVQENFMTRNGSLLPVNITTSPIADFGVVVVARDYSAEKAAVDELRRAKDDLEIIVAKRTSDLNTTNKELKAEIERRTAIEEHLRQAQKMDAIGQLAGGVAHDFNNMLGAILAVNDLMRMKFSDKHPDLKRYTDRIKDAGHSMAQLTAKLLAFARKGKLEMAVFDANDIIQEVIKLLKHSIDKRIAIHEALCTRPAFILCDKAQIQNALLNLALNARDAMPNGGTLKIISDIVAIDPVTGRFHGYVIPPGRYVLLAVSDTGTGMDDAVKAKLFEPFFTTKEMGQGTGLGLASVYGTVKGHGGYIHVDSAAGKGSVFTIHFPLREAPEPARKTTPSPLHQGKGCVLIVDDEELVRSTAAEILSDIGYSVATAGDGEEAVRYYGKHAKEVDLVVLDLIMPKLHGYECFMELKKNNPQVKVIIMSGYALEGEAKKAIDQGALGFVQKPYELGVFTKAIADALEGKPIH
jgi:signal transduction histidine kinase/CheY-like chemotaxis protein